MSVEKWSVPCECGHLPVDHAREVVPLSPLNPVKPLGRCLKYVGGDRVALCGCERYRPAREQAA